MYCNNERNCHVEYEMKMTLHNNNNNDDEDNNTLCHNYFIHVLIKVLDNLISKVINDINTKKHTIVRPCNTNDGMLINPCLLFSGA